MIPYILSPSTQTLTFYLNGKRIALQLSDARYDKVVNALALHDEAALKAVLTTSEDQYAANTASTVIFTYKDLRVLESANHDKIATHKGVTLARSVTDMILRQIKEGVTSFAHIEKFLDKLIKIKDKFVAGQLYAFLEKAELPITEDGTFIAYKGIKNNNFSDSGNTSTRVLTGFVDSQGHILNTPGSYISVERADVDTDPKRHCSTGLHVGSYSYASTFSQKLIYVEVDPLDVVSVPDDCNEKCRVCAYKVIGTECDNTDGPNLQKAIPHKERMLKEDRVCRIVADVNRAAKYIKLIEKYISCSETKKVTVSKLRRLIRKKRRFSADEVFRLCTSLGFNYTNAGDCIGQTLIHK